MLNNRCHSPDEKNERNIIEIGAIPGLTPSMAIALLLPITFSLPVVPSISLLMGI